MRIGIVGGGTVGRATARAFQEYVEEVRVWDIVPERRTYNLGGTLNSDIIFICLPTPQREGSLECNTDCLVEFFETLPDDLRTLNYVIRSTVPIGTTRRLREQYGLSNLVHSPEFLTARCANTDAQMPSRNIIGVPFQDGQLKFMVEGPWKDNGLLYDPNICLGRLSELYKRRFPGVPTYVMTSDESEAVKLFTNGFFATKIAYFNEVRCLADKLGLDWDRVMEGVLSDGRIAHSHTKVPGPDGKHGFGGACLPKDLANLISMFREIQVTPPYVCEAALSRNKEDRQR